MKNWLRERLRGRRSMPPRATVDDVPMLERAFGDEKPAVVNGVIVIPDISGYTEFVSTIALVHGQEIIGRMMKTIVSQEWEIMRVSKLIGDAVLMYRPDDATEPKRLQREVLARLHRVYREFTRERDITFDDRHVCACQACRLATRLELKFIVHRGEFLIYTIGPFRELMGLEVIRAFRLLKNQTEVDRYILMTDDFIQLDPTIEPHLTNVHEETYPHLGSTRVGSIDPATPLPERDPAT